jgi:hypothetical protein
MFRTSSAPSKDGVLSGASRRSPTSLLFVMFFPFAIKALKKMTAL